MEDLDDLLDSALDDFDVTAKQEKERRDRQESELQALRQQSEQQKQTLKQLQEQLQGSSSSGASKDSGITAQDQKELTEPEDLLDAALDDYVEGKKEEEENAKQKKTAKGPVDWDDHNLHHALEMFTSALTTLVEGSDQPEMAALAQTLEALAKDVGNDASDEDDEQQMAKVLESVESLKKLVGDDAELVQALDAAQAELLKTDATAPSFEAPTSSSSTSSSAVNPESTSTNPTNNQQFDARALTSMLSILDEALKQTGLQDESQQEDGDIGNDNFDKLVSKIMSPELFLPPFQRMKELYPKWLADNKATLSAEDLERYQKQYTKVTEICDLCTQLTDNGPTPKPEGAEAIQDESRSKRIWECIEEMHQYGKPPPELLDAL